MSFRDQFANWSWESVASINPLRYRGYVYDAETGFYYLQSRYYDPVKGRFISPDSYISTGQGILGNNMFAYCRNNPVCRKDVSGTTDEALLDDGTDLLDEEKTFNGGKISNGNSGRGINSPPVGYNNHTNPKVLSNQSKPPRFTPDQQAVLDLAKEHKNGVTMSEARILVDYANEYGISNHEPMMHITRSGIWSYTLHINIRNIHIPVCI